MLSKDDMTMLIVTFSSALKVNLDEPVVFAIESQRSLRKTHGAFY